MGGNGLIVGYAEDFSSDSIGSRADGETKRKSRHKNQASKKQATDPAMVQSASHSDGEFKEKQPPKSLVAMHRDTVDSTTSIPKKKSSSSGSRKRRTGPGKVLEQQEAWDRADTGQEGSEEELFYRPAPTTMLLQMGDDEPALQGMHGSRQSRKKLDRSSRQRSDVQDKTAAPGTPGRSLQPIALDGSSPVLINLGDMDPAAINREEVELEEEEEEEMLARLRKEERERELRKLESLEKRIGMEDGTAKRLGEKVEIIEKQEEEQKVQEMAQRQLLMEEELARKEEERKAYEEVMRAQEAEYERHLQKMLQQEQERNEQYANKVRREEEQRQLKRKLAMFRQNQNIELRQHVRMSKLKQKFTMPYKYSYFPLLKTNYMRIVSNITTPKKPAETKTKKGSLKRGAS